jgi:hypothetical protein
MERQTPRFLFFLGMQHANPPHEWCHNHGVVSQSRWMLFGILHHSMHHFLFLFGIILYLWIVTLYRSILDATFIHSAIVLFIKKRESINE